MIICSCAVITSDDVERAVAWMRAADPQAMVTPGKVYRALGKKPVCGGCARLFVAAVHSVPAGAISTPTDLPPDLRNLRASTEGRARHEGRRKGHRLPEPGAPQRADGG